ncbi:cuticle collagen 13-like [Perognathus longimembris pacificus]|uniref:cuticle collagen 13-like n=1 Tax=Perognathus longimembris pacificus TaxID=214514 RepID=UPI0020192FAF|nr:cuticle collagen 13-like [Perognathus longimembris pacificus]
MGGLPPHQASRTLPRPSPPWLTPHRLPHSTEKQMTPSAGPKSSHGRHPGPWRTRAPPRASSPRASVEATAWDLRGTLDPCTPGPPGPPGLPGSPRTPGSPDSWISLDVGTPGPLDIWTHAPPAPSSSKIGQTSVEGPL